MKLKILTPASGLAILLFMGAIQQSNAQSWPSQTVKIITPFPPGSGGDVTARHYADGLIKRWGRPVIVENRAGGHGIVAVTAVTGANDGHTLLYTNGGPLTSDKLSNGNALPYDPARDLVPISAGAEAFVGIGVPAALGVNSLAGFVDLARSRPGELNWGATQGALDYLVPAFFKSASIELVRLSYRDVASVMQDLSQARLHLYVAAVATELPMVQAGLVNILAVTSGERAPGLDGVPTVDEAGFPGLRFEAFLGFFGPRAMPDHIRDRISADIRATASSEDLAPKFKAMSMKVRVTTPSELEKIVGGERATLARITGPTQQ